jgi:hypothetical protein
LKEKNKTKEQKYSNKAKNHSKTETGRTRTRTRTRTRRLSHLNDDIGTVDDFVELAPDAARRASTEDNVLVFRTALGCLAHWYRDERRLTHITIFRPRSLSLSAL